MKKENFFSSPWVVMAVTAIMYVAKWAAKMWVGRWVNSPALIADGIHNLADLIEVGFVMIFGVYIANLPKSQKYPMGLKRVESILVLGIGIALLWLTYDTATKSFSGLASLWPAADAYLRPRLPSWLFPVIPNPLVSKSAAVGIFLTTGISAVISIIIGRYEIRVGKKAGMMSMAADGEETLSDARIELATFAGFAVKFAFLFTLRGSFPKIAPVIGSCIEYALGLLVAVMVFKTSEELLRNAFKVLLARSIGEKKVATIRDLIMRVEGVRAVEKMVTFSDGSTATCIVSVVTNASSKAHRPLLRTLIKRISAYLSQFEEYLKQDVHVEFVRPKLQFLREAQAVIVGENGQVMSAPVMMAATHFRIYDMDGEGNRNRAVDVPTSGMNLKDMVDKLIYKNVRVVSVFIGDDAERRVVTNAGIHYELCATLRVYIPRIARDA